VRAVAGNAIYERTLTKNRYAIKKNPGKKADRAFA
jgi:hypothetical protein